MKEPRIYWRRGEKREREREREREMKRKREDSTCICSLGIKYINKTIKKRMCLKKGSERLEKVTENKRERERERLYLRDTN